MSKEKASTTNLYSIQILDKPIDILMSYAWALSPERQAPFLQWVHQTAQAQQQGGAISNPEMVMELVRAGVLYCKVNPSKVRILTNSGKELSSKQLEWLKKRLMKGEIR